METNQISSAFLAVRFGYYEKNTELPTANSKKNSYNQYTVTTNN